jgi:riboflavin synthase
VLVDAAGRVGAGGHLFDGEAETLVATTPAAPATAVDAWKAAGAEVLICEQAPAGVDLSDLARGLGERGVLELLVEGGPRLQASLWAAGLADRLVWYLAPLAIGGRGGHPDRRPPPAPGLGRPPRRRPASGGVSSRQGGRLMFTGIIEGTGTVAALAAAADGSGARLEVEAPFLAGGLGLGESVAVNGCCLTVAEATGDGFGADLVAETLRRTALGGLAAGDLVNLERPMTLGGRLGGHLVQGHVDGVARVLERTAVGDGEEVRIELPAELARYVVEKGSVAVDGVSLTVAGVGPGWFAVALVPHTLEVTTLGRRRPGDPVQLEVDVVAKYVERLVAPFTDRAGAR